MSRLILHTGVPKTGSSAIQSFLCRHSALPLNEDGQLFYGVHRKGQLLRGGDVMKASRFRPLRYTPSTEKLDEVLGSLTLSDFEAGPLLLSQESWSRQAQALSSLPFEIPVDVVMFVRPQAQWLSSAWWQWFAWTNRDGNPVHAWRVLKEEGVLDWTGLAESFLAQPAVRRVELRLFDPGTDIVAQFLNTIGARPPVGVSTASFRRNASLTTHHLALYRAVPFLRPDNAGTMDAVLRALWPYGSKPPMPVRQELAAEIIESCRSSNEQLLTLLPEGEAQKMREDPSWWEACAYAV